MFLRFDGSDFDYSLAKVYLENYFNYLFKGRDKYKLESQVGNTAEEDVTTPKKGIYEIEPGSRFLSKTTMNIQN